MIENQAYIFSIFILNGIIIGFLFDIFRILRKTFKTKDVITYIQDILFWILTGALILYSIFTFSNGEIRLYMFLGVFLGTLFYIFVISSYFIKTNVLMINTTKHILGKIIHFFIYPFKLIYKILKKSFKEEGKREKA